MIDTIILPAGSVEYSIEDARTPIDDMIALLQSAKINGAEYVVMESGNWRGAKWQCVVAEYDWHEDVIDD